MKKRINKLSSRHLNDAAGGFGFSDIKSAANKAYDLGKSAANKAYGLGESFFGSDNVKHAVSYVGDAAKRAFEEGVKAGAAVMAKNLLFDRDGNKSFAESTSEAWDTALNTGKSSLNTDMRSGANKAAMNILFSNH
jgi:hypothetical protein